MALHKDLTGANLHEPKGAAAASSGQVYVADGSGSGAWTTLTLPSGNFFVTTAEFTTSGTWSKPANLIAIKVTLIGGGGGTANSGASNGGDTIFGSFCTAGGGNGSTASLTGLDFGVAGGNANFGGFLISDLTTSAFNYSNPIRPEKGKARGLLDGTNTKGPGSYGFKWIRESDLPSSVTVTIGSAGSGGNGTGTVGYAFVEQFIRV